MSRNAALVAIFAAIVLLVLTFPFWAAILTEVLL